MTPSIGQRVRRGAIRGSIYRWGIESLKAGCGFAMQRTSDIKSKEAIIRKGIIPPAYPAPSNPVLSKRKIPHGFIFYLSHREGAATDITTTPRMTTPRMTCCTTTGALHASVTHVRFSLPDAYHVPILNTTPAHTLAGSRTHPHDPSVLPTPADRGAQYHLIPIPLRPRRPAPPRFHAAPARFPGLANADLPGCVPPCADLAPPQRRTLNDRERDLAATPRARESEPWMALARADLLACDAYCYSPRSSFGLLGGLSSPFPASALHPRLALPINPISPGPPPTPPNKTGNTTVSWMRTSWIFGSTPQVYEHQVVVATSKLGTVLACSRSARPSHNPAQAWFPPRDRTRRGHRVPAERRRRRITSLCRFSFLVPPRSFPAFTSTSPFPRPAPAAVPPTLPAKEPFACLPASRILGNPGRTPQAMWALMRRLRT
ncbi:hypothetical protein B0H13DRAFT_1911677 [Mycena leptocephala]|nr:hypothetical protein B0H13DRAFT_1911677 [Mycena leptocephala]